MNCAQAVETETVASGLRKKCPACGGRDLLPSVTFEALPVLCNALHASAASAARGGNRPVSGRVLPQLHAFLQRCL